MSKLIVSISKASDTTLVQAYTKDGGVSISLHADDVEVIDARPIVEPERRRRSRSKPVAAARTGDKHDKAPAQPGFLS